MTAALYAREPPTSIQKILDCSRGRRPTRYAGEPPTRIPKFLGFSEPKAGATPTTRDCKRPNRNMLGNLPPEFGKPWCVPGADGRALRSGTSHQNSGIPEGSRSRRPARYARPTPQRACPATYGGTPLGQLGKKKLEAGQRPRPPS